MKLLGKDSIQTYKTIEDALLAPGMIYLHYKGGVYRALGVAKHTETKELMVVYEHLWPHEHSYFVRPQEMFFDTVEVDGKTKPRFQFIRNN